MESIPGARVFLLFTYRPEFVHTWGGKSYHSQLNLNRLSNRESLAMVTHLLASKDLNRALEELILKKTEGVPFFIEEFVKSLRDLKVIVKKNNRFHLAEGTQEVTIPSTVQDVVMARIDSLPEGAKEVLQTGAVIDREFSYELIKRVADLPEDELLSRLSGLRDSELIYERGIYPHNNYIFKHALTQEVAYNSLLLKRRDEIHKKIAQAIEVSHTKRLEEYYELLAYHYVRSDDKQKAVEYLHLANQKADNASALEEARGYFDQAMKLLDLLPESEENLERRISLLINQSNVFQFSLRAPEYHDLLTHYKPLATNIKNRGLTGAFLVRLGLCEWTFGYFDQAMETSKRGAELCEETGDAKATGFALGTIQWSRLYRGEFDEVLDLKNDILRKMEEQFNLRTYLRALEVSSLACSWRGWRQQAIEQGEQALNVAQEFHDNDNISFAAFIISLAYSYKGDWSHAIEYGELAVEKATTRGSKAFAQAASALALSRAGEPEKGGEILAKITPIVRAAHTTTVELPFTVYLSEAYLLKGDYALASETAEEDLELAARTKARPHLGFAHRLLGEVALKTNPDDAQPHFQKAISIFKQIKAENELALAYSGMGRYYKQQGNTGQAREYLTQALEIFNRLGTLIEPDKVRKELGDLPQ
jgi:tetratricopeptide (TPR) repeat protein